MTLKTFYIIHSKMPYSHPHQFQFTWFWLSTITQSHVSDSTYTTYHYDSNEILFFFQFFLLLSLVLLQSETWRILLILFFICKRYTTIIPVLLFQFAKVEKCKKTFLFADKMRFYKAISHNIRHGHAAPKLFG